MVPKNLLKHWASFLRKIIILVNRSQWSILLLKKCPGVLFMIFWAALKTFPHKESQAVVQQFRKWPNGKSTGLKEFNHTSGMSQRQSARQFNISQQRVCQILQNNGICARKKMRIRSRTEQQKTVVRAKCGNLYLKSWYFMGFGWWVLFYPQPLNYKRQRYILLV